MNSEQINVYYKKAMSGESDFSLFIAGLQYDFFKQPDNGSLIIWADELGGVSAQTASKDQVDRLADMLDLPLLRATK